MQSKRHSFPVLRFVLSFACWIFTCQGAHAQSYFAQPTVVPTGSWPQNVQAGAFTQGKAPGFAFLGYTPASSSGAPFSVLTNDGSGHFKTAYGPAQQDRQSPGFALGDTRGKGTLDIVRIVGGTQVTTLLGDGSGGFTGSVVGQLSSVGAQAPAWTYAALGKLNGSSTVPTLFAEDTANQTLVVVRNDNAAFSQVLTTISLANDGTGQFLVADLNGDGNIDILVLNGKSHIATPYYGKGDGTFTPAYAFTLPNGVFSMALADIDGDGRPELFLSDSDGAVFFFENSAAYGLLATAVPVTGAGNGLTGNGGHLLGIADLNGDGLPDLVTATPAGIGVLLGVRSGNAHAPQYSVALKSIYNGGPGRASAMLADFNGDGKLDLALDSPEGIAILYGNGDGTFATSLAFSAGQPADEVALGSFTSSGHLDAVVATGIPQVQLLNGDGAGNFAATLPASPAGAAETNSRRTLFPHLAVGDFDGDGREDVAITLDGQPPLPYDATGRTTPDGLSIQFGQGDGTFTAPVSAAPLPGSPHFGHSAVGDFNGDGISDIANLDVGFEATYLGGAAARSGSMPQSVFYADTSNDSVNFDEDAYDLVATGFLNPGSTRHDVLMQDDGEFFLFQNNGDDTFSPAATDQVPVFTAPANYVSVNANTSQFPGQGIFPTAMKLADLDGDGYGDAVVLYHNLASDPAHPDASTPNQIEIRWGKGNRNFDTPTVLTLSRNYYELALADIDGDGKPDLVLSDGNLLAVLYNQGNRTFGNEQHFLAGQGINLIAPGDVNHDGAQDVVVANGGTVLSNPVVIDGALPYTAELNTGGVTVLLNAVRPHAVTGGLLVNPEPSVYGQNFTITATITQPSGAVTPGGAVDFSVDGAYVGSGTVTNNQSTWAVVAPTLLRGNHAIAATYKGDGVYSPANFSGTHAVKGLPSVTSITNLLTPIFYGQEIGYTNGVNVVFDAAAVSTPPAGASTAGGQLSIYLDGQLVCSLVEGGVGPTGAPQRCNDANFVGYEGGPHILSASYLGDNFFEPSDSPDSTVLIQPDDTTSTLTTSGSPATQGTAVTLTATITARNATPGNGTASFYDGSTLLGAVPLNGSNVASLRVSTLTAGAHAITVQYVPVKNAAGYFDFNPSSGPMQQVITPAASQATGTDFTVTVDPTTMSIGVGDTVSANVTVTAASGFTEPVALSCAGMPWESTCTFAAQQVAAGGGKTQLAIHVEAPHNCNVSQEYFQSGQGGWLAVTLGGLTALFFGWRRRKVLPLLCALMLCALPLLGGCGLGNCTDLGTRPGDYDVTVTGTGVGSSTASHTVSVHIKAYLDGQQ